MPIEETGAIILAGGKSARMGQDKALLEFEGEPMWRRQIGLFRSLSPREIFVSGPRRASFPSTLRHIEDMRPARGPLSGLAAALRVARCRMVLVVAVDLPRMSPGFLAALRERVRAGCGVVPFTTEGPEQKKFYEPLAAIYSRACLPIAERHLAGKDWSMQKFIRAAVAAGLLLEFRIPRGARRLFLNANTPEAARHAND